MVWQDGVFVQGIGKWRRSLAFLISAAVVVQYVELRKRVTAVGASVGRSLFRRNYITHS